MNEQASGTVSKRLTDDQREDLMAAFHPWDHAHLSTEDCPRCIEFVYDFEPLIRGLMSEAWREGFAATDRGER